MKEIKLTHGQVAFVDDADYEWLNRWKWRAKWNNSARSYYAVRTTEPKKVTKDVFDITMQRQILGLKPKESIRVYHKDRNALNNRLSNLERRKQLPTIGNKKICGIYKITTPEGKIYIGQAIDCNKRKNHYQEAHCKHQLKVYNSIIKYGWDKHKFEVIEECERKQLDEREIYYIKFFDCFNTKHGLNLKTGGQFGSPVVKWTKEACLKSAKSFEYKSHWKKANSSAYNASRKEGWHDECCAHMKKKLNKWKNISYEEVLKRVMLLNERHSFKKWSDLHKYADTLNDKIEASGWKDRIVKELNLPALKMKTNHELITIGKQYTSRIEWLNDDRNSYRAADSKGLIDAFRHMPGFTETYFYSKAKKTFINKNGRGIPHNKNKILASNKFINWDLIEQRFGTMIVLSKDKSGAWLCRCDCGNEKIIRTINLKRRKKYNPTKCGCKSKYVSH